MPQKSALTTQTQWRMEPSNRGNHVTDTARQSKQTWLDYYLAVKKGDLKSVRSATSKDFRISLTMDKSALEIAALYGHKNLVEYFLEKTDEKKDLMLVIEGLKDALRGGHLDLAKLMMDYLQRPGLSSRIGEELIEEIIRAAINGKSLDCLKFIWDFAVDKDLSLYVKTALTGSFEMLKFIRENCDLPDHPTPLVIILPGCGREIHFYTNGGEFSLPMVFIAFHEYEKLTLYYREKQWNVNVDGPIDKLERYVIKTWDRQSEEPWRLLDVAAFYGHLDLVKREIQAVKSCSSEAPSLDERLQSAFKYSLRNNHVHILDYLINENLVKPRPPYEYEGFNINEAFYFVKERTSHIEMTEIPDMLKKNLLERIRVMCSFEDNKWGVKYGQSADGTFKCINLCEDRSALRLTNIEEYYEYLLNSCGENVSELEISDFFMEALSEQNVDAALCFKNRIGASCCATSEATHLLRMMIETAMGAYMDLSCITSPVIVELLLGDKPCRVEHAAELLPHFLKPTRLFHLDRRLLTIHSAVLDTYVRYYPLDLYVKRAEAILAVLFCDVSKFRPDTLAKFNFISTFVCPRSNGLRESAGKILALMNCTRVVDSSVELKNGAHWLIIPWNDRVTFLTEFLIGLCRFRWRNRLYMSGLLVYMLDSKSDDFTGHFLNLLKISGIDVEDALYTTPKAYAIIPSDKRQKFDATLASIKERVPSLMECARHALHHHYLLVAHEAHFHVSVGTLVGRAASDLPRHLQQFLQFDDVYRNIERVQEGNKRGYLRVLN